MESFGRMLEILLTVVLLFLVPINYMAIKQDAICQTYATTEVSYFVDSVRNLGYVTDQMYLVFLKKLEATNQVYDIEMIHYKRKIDPVIGEDESESGNQNNYYCTYTEDILNQLFENTSGDAEVANVTIDNDNGDLVSDGTVINNSYRFYQGDYFTVKVSNKNKTLATKLQEFFLQRSLPTKQIIVVYGGAIRDEAY